MAQDINAAVSYLQTLIGEIAGMRQAPEAPTEQGQFPFGVSFVSALVESTQSSKGYQKNLYEITSEIHVARRDLPRDYNSIAALGALFPAKVWGDLNANNAALNGYVDTINGISGALVPSTWGGVETISWVFKINVKVMSAWIT